MKKIIPLLIKVTITLAGLGFIGFLVFKQKDQLIGVFQNFEWPWFLLGAMIYLVIFMTISVRLKWILSVQDIRLSWPRLFYLNLISQFFSLFLPSSVGGDVVKGFYIYKDTQKKSHTFMGIFLDRLSGCVGLFVMAFLILCFRADRPELYAARNVTLIVLLAAAAGFVCVLSRRVLKVFKKLVGFIPLAAVKDLLQRLLDQAHAYRHHKMLLINILLISMAGQVIIILANYMLAKSLQLNLTLSHFFLLIPLINALSMAPSINGLGVREAGFVYFFSWYVTQEQALALSLAYGGLIYLMGFSFGILYMCREGWKGKELKQALDFQEKPDQKK